MSTPDTTDNLIDKNWLEVYKQVCANIKVSDDISFKLLELVPGVAGIAAGSLAFLAQYSTQLESERQIIILGGTFLISILGAVITFGFYRWELRNIQKCIWLMQRAEGLESYACRNAVDSNLLQPQYLGWLDMENPRLLKHPGEMEKKTEKKKRFLLPPLVDPWGKTEAESLIYLAAIAAWLVPALLAGLILLGLLV